MRSLKKKKKTVLYYFNATSNNRTNHARKNIFGTRKEKYFGRSSENNITSERDSSDILGKTESYRYVWRKNILEIIKQIRPATGWTVETNEEANKKMYGKA